MINQKLFETVQRKISERLHQIPVADLKQNTKAQLSTLLSRLDLVTREEFDLQTNVLLKTRGQVERLEKRIAELEAQYKALTEQTAEHL